MMDKQILFESAAKLGPFGKPAAEAYRNASEKMVARINSHMTERADIRDLVPENARDMMKDNHANHARFIASILKDFNSEVLVETILWVFRAYRSRSFSPTYWAAQINSWILILEEELPREAYLDILPLYEWIQIYIPLFDKITGEQEPPV